MADKSCREPTHYLYWLRDSDDEGTNGYALANLFENNVFLLLNGMHGFSAGNEFDANEHFRYYMNGASISPRLIKQLSLFT